MFLLQTTGTWGEPMFADGRVFPFSIAGLVSRCAEWPIPSITDTRRWTKFCSGKRGMVRAGGSASRTIDDRDAPDPGGGGGSESWGRGAPTGLGTAGGMYPQISMDPNAQGFPALGSLSPAEGRRRERPVPDNSRDVLAKDTPKVPTSPLEMGRGQAVPLGRSVGVSQRGMRPAGAVRPSQQNAPVGVLDVRENPAVRPLSAEAVEFSPTLGPRTGVTAGLVNSEVRAIQILGKFLEW